jgi:glycopeptide antibiotics resistance protein
MAVEGGPAGGRTVEGGRLGDGANVRTVASWRPKLPHEGSRVFKFTDGELLLIPGLVAVFPALPIAGWLWSMERSLTWRLMALLALAHITLVIALTIFPIPIDGQRLYRETRGLTEDNLIPFATIAATFWQHTPARVAQLAGNLVALAPLGVYGPYLWPFLRTWRRFVFVAAAAAVTIECTQFAGSWLEGFTYRVTDIDDALTNTTGAVVAYFLWRRYAPRLEQPDLPWPATH